MSNEFISKVTFWKLSQSRINNGFLFRDILECIDKKMVYIGINTGAIGNSSVTQAEHFVNAKIGDYFYLTHGNEGIYLLGQFTGAANYFNKLANDDHIKFANDGYIERSFHLIKFAKDLKEYTGSKHGWTPNQNSTFFQVPSHEYNLFEQEILKPYFDIDLTHFK